MQVVFPDDWNDVFATAPEMERLRARAEVVVHRVRPDNDAGLTDILKDADVAVAIRERTRFDARLLERMPNLKLIVSIGGRENPSIDKATAFERGVLVCYTAGAVPTERPSAGDASMVELTIGMMMSAMREFGEQDRAMRAGEWPAPRGRILRGKTLGIVGLGRLGTGVARVAQFLGMRVIAAGLTLTPERASAAGVEFRSLEDLFSEADVISVHLKSTDTTRSLIDRKLLGRMKPDALLVNTARGPIVNEADLVDALQRGAIGGAALDVYDQEPLPPDHPLRHTERTLLLAHCGWPTDDGYSRIVPETVAVIEAFLDGAPINVENPSTSSAATAPVGA
jgi:phosphoglycerate dehydrogenase-like enzyme